MRIFADIETSDGLLGCEFALACCWDGKGKIYTFRNKGEFFRYLIKPGKVYFHNLDFDGRFAIEYCINNGLVFELVRRAGKLLCIKIFLGMRRGRPLMCELIDSLSLIPLKLKKFTDVFGLKVKKLDLTDLEARCRNDVIILKQGLEKFWEYYSYAKNALTLPQAAYREIKQKIPPSVFFTSDGKDVNLGLENDARAGYFGGRVEAFSLKYFDEVRHYDVNSMYPYVMQRYEYPVGIAKRKNFNEVRKDGLLYLAHTRINIPYMFIPPLPTKMTKLYFCYGVIDGWFYSPELNYCLDELGLDVQVDKFYCFYGDHIFRDFITEHYKRRLELKKQGNALETIEKLIMNSGYGKFGQKREYESHRITLEAAEGAEILYDGDNPIMCIPASEFNPTRFINPVISGFITSYARLELLKWLHKADTEAIYSDTDSLVTTAHLPTSDELGGLKLEYRGAFQAFTAKVYWQETRVKAKGFSIKGAKFESPAEFYSVLLKGTATKGYAKCWESLKKGKPLLTKVLEKKLRSEYRKRRVLPSKDTEPWDSKEIEIMERSAEYGLAVIRKHKAEYEAWKLGDYYDRHAEDNTLTEREKYEEFLSRWRDYA